MTKSTLTMARVPVEMQVGNLLTFSYPRPSWWRLIRLYRRWRESRKVYTVTRLTQQTMTISDQPECEPPK